MLIEVLLIESSIVVVADSGLGGLPLGYQKS